MVKINWSELSISDLKSIHDYISQDSKRYASITINKIYHRAQLLIEQPLLGRIVPEFNDSNIRELIIGNYRLVYKVVDKYTLDILRVYSSARLLKEDNLK